MDLEFNAYKFNKEIEDKAKEYVKKQDEEFKERMKEEYENYKKKLDEEFDKKLKTALVFGIKDKEDFYNLLYQYENNQMLLNLFKSKKEVEYLIEKYPE